MSFLMVDCLTHWYAIGEEKQTVLHDVTFNIEQGKFVTILGPSGCGKTTLLNIIGGLEQPSKGDITVDGVSISKLGPGRLASYRRDKIAFMFQFFNLFPTLTARENVIAGIEILGLSKSEIRDRAVNYLNAVGLSDKGGKLPSQLSGGEQQRVAIARALAKRAPLILADEPTGNLDQASGHMVMDLLTRIHRENGVTILMITHDESLASKGDFVMRMCDGKLSMEP